MATNTLDNKPFVTGDWTINWTDKSVYTATLTVDSATTGDDITFYATSTTTANTYTVSYPNGTMAQPATFATNYYQYCCEVCELMWYSDKIITPGKAMQLGHQGEMLPLYEKCHDCHVRGRFRWAS